MSDENNKKLSNMIRTATADIIANTETFVKSVENTAPGEDTVSIMINGEKHELNKSDYDQLKSQNAQRKQQLKADIAEYKKQLKI